MVEKVEHYKTSDGKVFADLQAAEAHEMGIKLAAEIEAFCVQHQYRRATAGFLRKAIPEWEAFKAAKARG